MTDNPKEYSHTKTELKDLALQKLGLAVHLIADGNSRLALAHVHYVVDYLEEIVERGKKNDTR